MSSSLQYLSDSNKNIGYFTPNFNEREIAYNKSLFDDIYRNHKKTPLYPLKLDLGAGDDVYYVDTEYKNYSYDNFLHEAVNAGKNDTVKSYVNITLPENFENLVLMDDKKQNFIEGTLAIGTASKMVKIYGHPNYYNLDYGQGDSKYIYKSTYYPNNISYGVFGTCPIVSVGNIKYMQDSTYFNESNIQNYFNKVKLNYIFHNC